MSQFSLATEVRPRVGPDAWRGRRTYARLVRFVIALALLVACDSSSSKSKPTPTPSTEATTPGTATAPKAAPKPPDELDEKMRHCPLALEGAASTLEDIEGGVRFTIHVPEGALEEARRRAHHIVEFAAKRTREGHGDFDGKGGGHMKNCPVVTDDVTITTTDVPGGTQLDVTSADVARLRAETRARASKFSFDGATVTAR